MRSWKRAGALMAACGFMAACSGGGSGGGNSEASGGKSINISGKFDPNDLNSLGILGIQPFARSYEVYCMTFSQSSRSASAVISAVTGEFSLNLNMQPGEAMGCFFVTKVDGIMNGWVAMVKEAKTSSQGGGQSVGQDGYAIPSDATKFEFGDINVTTNASGAIVVSAPDAAADGDAGTIPSFVGMTGEWTITSFASTDGHLHPCEMDGDVQSPTEIAACKVLWQAVPVYLRTFDVTNGSESRSFISFWGTKAQFNACDAEGMTLAGGWSSSDAKVQASLPDHHAAEIDWQDISPEALTAAWFRFSHDEDDIESNNCPYSRIIASTGPGGPIYVDPSLVVEDSGGKNAFAQCQAARSCADFNWANSVEGTKGKVACLVESLQTRSSDRGYQWNSTGSYHCSRTMDVPHTDLQTMLADVTGVDGCDSADCGGIVTDARFKEEPRTRRFLGELFTSGNLGSGVSTELDQQKDWDGGGSSFCYMNRQLSFKITQTSSTSAILALTMNVSARQGLIEAGDVPGSPGDRDPEADDVGKPWFDTEKCMEKEWVINDMGAPKKLKIFLKKAN